MRISSASLLSVVLSMILSLSAIYSGIGMAKADSVIATIPLSTFPAVAFPSGVAFDSANGDIYVTNSATETVSVIDGSTNKVIDNILWVDSHLELLLIQLMVTCM
jgi:YVTN family beta-propeller protein